MRRYTPVRTTTRGSAAMLLRGVRCLPTTLQRGSRGMRLTTLPPLRRPLARGGRGRRGESGRLHVALFYVSLVLALFGLGNLNTFLPLVSGSRFVARGVQARWFISGRRLHGCACCVWLDSGYIFTSVYSGFREKCFWKMSMYSALCLVCPWIHAYASVSATFGTVVFLRPLAPGSRLFDAVCA